MKSKVSMLAALCLGAAIALVIAGVSNGRGTGPAPERKLHSEARQVAAPSHEASIAAVRRGARIRYLESNATALAPGASDGFSFTCPKRTPRAIAGYGGTARAGNAGDIVIADSTPFRNGRSWSVGVKNLAAEPREFYVGVVCVG